MTNEKRNLIIACGCGDQYIKIEISEESDNLLTWLFQNNIIETAEAGHWWIADEEDFAEMQEEYDAEDLTDTMKGNHLIHR